MRLALVVVTAAACVVGGTTPAVAAPDTRHPPRSVATRHGDLPADAPPALYRAEPRLPAAAGWPGANAFPRTSGTGRLAGGGLYWSDFLYDDHGTTGVSLGNLSVTAGTPSVGTYVYPTGAAHNNGADLARAAVLRRPHATYWRVDWNTLADAKVPIAEWAVDTDDDPATGGSAWPAGAGVNSRGIDQALVVSSRGAQLIEVPSGRVRTHLPVAVGADAHSFVVRVPARVLAPHGRWRVRLVAGLANPDGTGFARPPQTLPVQPAVYNVGFRSATQERAGLTNFWNDFAQATALLTGNVSRFSRVIDWPALAAHARTAPERRKGWSDHWYVSAVDLGPGMVADVGSVQDGKPNYLGRVQPYAVYVPKGGPPAGGWPLTFLLHSSLQNHNQYASTTPRFTRAACEQRRSICVTTLGRGPDGSYWGSAELDFWQVWHQVSQAYRLDPDRTVLSGYSMGGIGSNALAMAHPDLFAKSVTLAGGVGAVPSLTNLRWVPTYLAGGAADELVPLPLEKNQADGLAGLGYRFRWVLYPAVDHVVYELADMFGDAAAYMGQARRVRNPGRFSFTWTPADRPFDDDPTALTETPIAWTQQPRLGVRTTGAYWLRGLRARTSAKDASITARSGQRPDHAATPRKSTGVVLSGGPGPGIATTQTWTRGKAPARTGRIGLRLTNVASLRVLVRAAGFRAHQRGVLTVTTDGSTVVHLGKRAVRFAAGTHRIHFRG